MKQISSIDLIFLTKELQILLNQRIETFYYEDKTFYTRIYIKGKGHKYLTINLGKYIYLSDTKINSSHPNPTIQFFRKYLKSSFIRKIEQIQTERIIKIEIEKKDSTETNTQTTQQNNQIKTKKYNLYLELFGNGNIILTNENNQILNSLTKKTFKDRTIKIKEKYELPPKNPLNILQINQQTLQKEIQNNQDLPIVKFLAIKFGLGGKFAEYICNQLNINFQENPKNINQQTLIQQLQKLPQLKPKAYLNENNTEFYPIDFNIKNQQKCESFNTALITYFSQFKTTIDPREKEFTKELKKLQNRLKKQQQTKEKTIKDYEKNNEIGTKIFENYTTVEQLLTSINKTAKTKGWDSIQNTIKTNPQLTNIIKKLDYKNDTIILNLK